MAYDTDLAARVRTLLGGRPGYQDKAMFGGLCCLARGNMACGLIADELIVRLPPGDYEAGLAEPHTRVFDFTGRPMRGWLVVAAEGLADDGELADWVERGWAFACSLPPK